ncbi:precorrin-6A reductase [Natronincola ferrireducens]|uniref:Precorrin-6A/cobalt-precorrin-6A reductase n=1 Tax=Natronincola ferrireducens TaxID=393762 RepID=A0A1G8WUF7_9FIRM|nr:precorrin-6A reductase [Natronincola ferrireducens]SDJ81265.1 precorrin-6A/cobalt-precorrin-6A reductase [Natronincola ferrireducens]
MILALCGTSEGRELVAKLLEKQLKVLTTVTTGYGAKLLREGMGVEVLEGRLDKEKMKALVNNKGLEYIVDITHPYAENISRLAIEVAKEEKIHYLRYERKATSSEDKHILLAKDFDEAAKLAKSFRGNIFLTVGSNHIPTFLREVDVNRLVARVLPLSTIVQACEDQGFTPDNLIAMKGPFNEEMNKQMFETYRAAVIVTKDSGKAGGTEEKIAAAKTLNLPVILVKKPSISYGEVYDDMDSLVHKIASIRSK